MRSVIRPTNLHFHDLAGHFLALTAGDRFLRLSGVLHLEFTKGAADLGLSVSPWARGKGIGTLPERMPT